MTHIKSELRISVPIFVTLVRLENPNVKKFTWGKDQNKGGGV